jgi:hypothetical protein
VVRIMTATSTLTLGAELERDRLERRLRWMTVAVDLLRSQASDHHSRSGAIPRSLGLAITDFEAQIATINARLRDLGGGPPSALQRHSL